MSSGIIIPTVSLDHAMSCNRVVSVLSSFSTIINIYARKAASFAIVTPFNNVCTVLCFLLVTGCCFFAAVFQNRRAFGNFAEVDSSSLDSEQVETITSRWGHMAAVFPLF